MAAILKSLTSAAAVSADDQNCKGITKSTKQKICFGFVFFFCSLQVYFLLVFCMFLSIFFDMHVWERKNKRE